MRLARRGRLCARKAPHFNHPRKALSVTDERSAFVARELSHVLTGRRGKRVFWSSCSSAGGLTSACCLNGGHSRDDNPPPPGGPVHLAYTYNRHARGLLPTPLQTFALGSAAGSECEGFRMPAPRELSAGTE